MSDQNQFQASEEQRDLEALRDFVPEWANERVEPWTPPVSDSVVPPTWNKIRLESSFSGSGGSPADQAPIVSFIAGVQIGAAFIPKIVDANGTFRDIP